MKCALSAFDAPEVAAVGGISLLPEAASNWARAANYVFRLASKSGYSVQADHLAAGDSDDIPGCNAFYRSDAFKAVGLFDENLVTAEDVRIAPPRSRDGNAAEDLAPALVWHDKRPTPRGLFRQMRRFAEGRVQLSRKIAGYASPATLPDGMVQPLASLVAAAVAATLATSVILGAAIGAWLLLASAALADREPLGAAVLVAPAMTIVMLGWSYGYLKEQFFPMASTVGR